MLIGVRHRISDKFQQEFMQRFGYKPMSDTSTSIDSTELTDWQLALLDKATRMILPFPYQLPIFDTAFVRNRLHLCKIVYLDAVVMNGVNHPPLIYVKPMVFDCFPSTNEIFEALAVTMGQYGAAKALIEESVNRGNEALFK